MQNSILLRSCLPEARWDHFHSTEGGVAPDLPLCSRKNAVHNLFSASKSPVRLLRCPRSQASPAWPSKCPAPAGFSVRLELSSFLSSWCVTFYTCCLTFCSISPKELTRNGKDGEEIRWSNRTLQLLNTLQVPVLDFVIRWQNWVLISVGPCQKISCSRCRSYRCLSRADIAVFYRVFV